MKTQRVTINRVNAALKAAGFKDCELIHGEGYFYFAGSDTSHWYQTSVEIFHLSDFTVNEWVAFANKFDNDIRIAYYDHKPVNPS
jgi:hypothetical protein